MIYQRKVRTASANFAHSNTNKTRTMMGRMNARTVWRRILGRDLSECCQLLKAIDDLETKEGCPKWARQPLFGELAEVFLGTNRILRMRNTQLECFRICIRTRSFWIYWTHNESHCDVHRSYHKRASNPVQRTDGLGDPGRPKNCHATALENAARLYLAR